MGAYHLCRRRAVSRPNNEMQFEFVNQAVTHFFVGFGFALFNLALRYFAPWLRQFVSVLHYRNKPRAIMVAYLIALTLQMITSLLFRTIGINPYRELAWSPYEAAFNVIGIIAMDLLIATWLGMRRGAEVSRRGLEVVKTRASAELDELGEKIRPGGANEAPIREDEAQQVAERKQRIDDRLGDY